MRFVRVNQPQSSRPAPWLEKKKGDRKRARHSGLGLEGFVDWAGIIANEPAEEEEMSRLAARFVARVRK